MSGPRGKRNAAKHGLYTKRLSAEERDLIEALPVESVTGEIGMQRALIARLLGILGHNGLGPGDEESLPDDTRNTLKLLKAMMNELRLYVRMHTEEQRRLNDPTKEFEQGKNLARRRRNVFTYLQAEDDEDEEENQGPDEG
jgi:hypothetical protein